MQRGELRLHLLDPPRVPLHLLRIHARAEDLQVVAADISAYLQPGDLVIICAYGTCEEAEAIKHKPTLVYVDRHNALTHTNHSIPKQAA